MPPPWAGNVDLQAIVDAEVAVAMPVRPSRFKPATPMKYEDDNHKGYFRRRRAQPSFTTCLARPSASASAGTASVITLPAAR